MIRYINGLLISLLLIFTLSSANTHLSIKVNNNYVKSDVEPFIKNGTTYVPIRFVSDALNVDSVNWNEKNRTVTIKDGNTTILLIANQKYAYINGDYTELDSSVIIYNGRTFVPIRFVSTALNSKVDWNESTYTVSIKRNKSDNSIHANNAPNKNETSNKPSNNGNTSNNINNNTSSNSTSNNNSNSNNSYNEDEVYWLSRIIEAEAGGEPFKGKVAVGEVILNRVKSDEFPNTIWGVIFDSKFGIQFEPVANGSIYNTPSQDSIKAAKTALSGSNYIGDCLYFLNPIIASSNWIVKNRDFYTTIANHDFYA